MKAFATLLAGFAAVTLPAYAQDLGDPDAGRNLAEEVCSPCHAVAPGEGVMEQPLSLPYESLEPYALEDIANTRGITPTALFAWLTTSHPTMPNIVLEDEELRNVVAYILSLRAPE